MSKFFGHLKTVLKHKYWVWYYMNKCGHGWRGLWHDMSKFSPTEFWESVKYYSGTRSPIDACKEDKGISMAWMHHAYITLSAGIYPAVNQVSNLKLMAIETYRSAGYEISARCCSGITELTISW